MPTPEEDHEAIRRLYEHWFGAMHRGDIDGFLSLLAEPFLLKCPGQPPFADLPSLRDGLERFHASYSGQGSYSLEELEVVGDWAWARITEAVTLTPRDGALPLHLSGMHLDILVRQVDGGWKVAREVSSLEVLTT